MSDSRTVLPDPKMLNLIGVSADVEVITLTAETASPKAGCPVCGKLSRRVHSPYTRTLADLPWQGVPVTQFLCTSEGSSVTEPLARERSSPSAFRVSRPTTLAEPSGWRAGSRTSLSPSVEKRVLVC